MTALYNIGHIHSPLSPFTFPISLALCHFEIAIDSTPMHLKLIKLYVYPLKNTYMYCSCLRPIFKISDHAR
jgi:hypothetical protein